MSDKLSGFYKIRSVVIKEEAATGVSLHKLPHQPVRVGGHAHIWKIAPNDNGTYHLSIRDLYRYTGVLDDKQVIATIEERENREWRIVHRPEHDAYAIELNTRIWPTPGWTIFERQPGADIVLRLIVTHPTEDQLFKLDQVYIEE